MLNFYQSNGKSYADAQPVYVATCITHGFFQDLCRTIGDAIFVHIVTSRVYITFMVYVIEGRFSLAADGPFLGICGFKFLTSISILS